MLERCRNPNCANYSYYGGRGIAVCERWLKFENFLADMGIAPPETSLDRIDGDGDYEPENCQWATRKEQSRNTRSNRMMEFNGRTQSAAAWAEEYDMSYDLLWNRLNLGWSTEDALHAPVRRRRTIEYGGIEMSLTEWARRLGVSRYTLKYRLDAGWSAKDILLTPPGEKR